MKKLIYILFFISTIFCSKIIDKATDNIKNLFPNYISIEHKMYKIPKDIKMSIQNTTKQKFFRPELNLWIITNEDSSKYYGILDNVKGRSLPITFLTVFNDSSQVYHSEIIKYREAYGGEVGNRSWLNQFNLYTDKSKYKVGDDISGITGATISVHSISKGIRKLSYLISEIIENDK